MLRPTPAGPGAISDAQKRQVNAGLLARRSGLFPSYASWAERVQKHPMRVGGLVPSGLLKHVLGRGPSVPSTLLIPLLPMWSNQAMFTTPVASLLVRCIEINAADPRGDFGGQTGAGES